MVRDTVVVDRSEESEPVVPSRICLLFTMKLCDGHDIVM